MAIYFNPENNLSGKRIKEIIETGIAFHAVSPSRELFVSDKEIGYTVIINLVTYPNVTVINITSTTLSVGVYIDKDHPKMFVSTIKLLPISDVFEFIIMPNSKWTDY
jgi:hypothetical protein